MSNAVHYGANAEGDPTNQDNGEVDKEDVAPFDIKLVVSQVQEKAERPKTLYFTVLSRFRKRRSGPKHFILQCFRAFGKGGAAQNIVFYNVFAPSEKAERPKTLYFTVFSRLRKRRSGPKHCILQCFRAFGKGEAAQNIVIYSVFAPSEKAERPKTL